MRACSLAETMSQNTREELTLCGEIFARAKLDKVLLISSPTHVPRCLKDACIIFSEKNYKFRNHLLACPADTCYCNSTVEDLAIVEPPHRGDRDKFEDEKPLHKLLALFFKEQKWRQRLILEGLHDLLGPETPLR
mmetsp:Transcript_15414/g.24005  ORF Transcript_15414/g.24005 Transcript_15414/m.24005 type:complete len:135 (+) Transcript_15414:308-712(+)